MVLIKDIKNNEDGFTLLEVMATLVLLAIIASSTLAIFTPASMWINQARKQTTACNYAYAILDDLRAHRSLLSGAVTPDTLDPDQSYKPDNMTASISRQAFPDLDHLYIVIVNVIYTGGEQTLQTVIKDY